MAPRKPGALFVQAHLLDRRALDVEPDVVRLVLGPDPFTVPRVRLYAQTLTLTLFRASDGLDTCPALPFEVRPDKLFEARVAREGSVARTRAR